MLSSLAVALCSDKSDLSEWGECQAGKVGSLLIDSGADLQTCSPSNPVHPGPPRR